MSVDIFLEDINKDEYKVYFVQLNTETTCKKSIVGSFCENILNSWVECMKMYNDTCDYLPLSKTAKLYNCNSLTQLSSGVIDGIPYKVEICNF